MVLAIAAIGPNAEITHLSILDDCRLWTAGTATLWLEYLLPFIVYHWDQL